MPLQGETKILIGKQAKITQKFFFCFAEKISYDISEQELTETQLKLRNPQGITYT